MDYHRDRFEDFSLLIFKNEKLYALLPANKNGNLVISHQGLTYGSFILQESAKLLDSFEALKSALNFLFTNEIANLTITNIPSFYHTVPAEELDYFMFKLNAKLLKRDVIMGIDYKHKLPFQKNRREGINKAHRNNLVVKIDNDFDVFWNKILIPNLANKHNASPVHTLEEIKLLASRFPENIKQVNVYKDHKIVAGTTVFLTKTTVHPQYVSGNLEKNKLGSIDLLYQFIIEEFKENRSYFSFNTSSENKGKLLNKGLVFWKESCGARPFVINTFALETKDSKNLILPVV